MLKDGVGEGWERVTDVVIERNSRLSWKSGPGLSRREATEHVWLLALLSRLRILTFIDVPDDQREDFTSSYTYKELNLAEIEDTSLSELSGKSRSRTVLIAE